MNSYVKVKVVGKNVNNYLKWLIKNRINIINLNIIKHNELDIIVDYKDYDRLYKYSKTYKINIIKRYGKLRLLFLIKNNSIILSCLLLAIIFLYILSNIIFSIEVVYNNQELVAQIENELAKYKIKKYQKKKSYEYLNKVKERILNDNKDTLEWLEIEENGTKYTIRLVERKKETQDTNYKYQSIISTKEAIITNIKAISGDKIKMVNEHVKKGDTVISGILIKPDGTNLYTQAKGEVLGEVWYKISIEYPLYYQEERVTGRSKFALSLYFLNKKFFLFSYPKFKQFKVKSKIILANNLLPIKIAKEKLYEVVIKEEIYTPESAIEKAIDYSLAKMKNKNKRIKDIKEIIVLNKQNKSSKIAIDIFVSVIEDITQIVEIKEEPNNVYN